MATQDALSVRLITQEVGQVSPNSKASDVIFTDGVDLQTKFNNATLVEPGSLNGVTAVSPKVEVFANTDTEFRLRIKSINGTIITPNLKGADANTVTGEIRQMLAELQNRVDDLEDLEDMAARLTQTNAALTETNTRVFELTDKVEDIESQLDDIYTKDEIGNIINDCVTGIAVADDNLVLSRVGAEDDTVPLFVSLTDDDINTLFE